MTWFENMMGFPEISPEKVRENIRFDGKTIASKINGREFQPGFLDIPNLAELRERVGRFQGDGEKISVRELVGDVTALHADSANAGSLFQVASQFNLLEMISPFVTPEKGVGIYEGDFTQGPACAVAAGAGTIYRNYFATVNGQVGQSSENQIDCLAELGRALGNHDQRLWKMRNGYALPTLNGLNEISQKLEACTESEKDGLRSRVRIGIQADTQVTLKNSLHSVSQAYCSALPIAYCNFPLKLWKGFAELILEAAYEATFCAAILNAERTGNNCVYLTLLGGGAFGNEPDWIIHAIRRALDLYRHADLQVAIVSFRCSDEFVRQLIQEF